MRLKDHLRDDLLLHGLEAADAGGFFDAVEEHLVELGLVQAGAEVSQALKVREDAHTTVLGEGVALPHATVGGLGDILLLVIRTKEPLAFGDEDAEPVGLFFVLLSPTGREGVHIKILARICRLAHHPGFLEELRTAQGRDEIREVLLRVDSQHA